MRKGFYLRYIKRTFFNGIVCVIFRKNDVATETVNFIFNSLLESLHDQKRNNGCRQANAYADHCNLVNGRRKSFPLLASYSFGYEIREVQIILNFSTGFHAK